MQQYNKLNVSKRCELDIFHDLFNNKKKSKINNDEHHPLGAQKVRWARLLEGSQVLGAVYVFWQRTETKRSYFSLQQLVLGDDTEAIT